METQSWKHGSGQLQFLVFVVLGLSTIAFSALLPVTHENAGWLLLIGVLFELLALNELWFG